MASTRKKDDPGAVDAYIVSHPESIRTLLETMRQTIREEAPAATERISYGIPTFFLGGNLVHYAAFEKHIGFYPGASGMEAFKDEMSTFKTGKGSVQFPLDRPLPLDLVRRIVRFRVEQNSARSGK